MTTFADLVFQLGGAPAGLNLPIAPGGTWYWVDPANGSTGNDGLAPVSDNAGHGPLATVGAAYAKCTAGHHDVIALIEADAASNETAAITWSKDYTHLVGFCAPVREGQRARLTCGANDLTPFVTISATGCVFANVRIWQGRDDNDTLINVSVTGARNYFSNVHFAGGGHATQAVDGGASLHINGGSENRFVECTIGVDTISAGSGMAGLVVAAAGGAARNAFERCNFVLHAGNAGAIFVELLGNGGLDRYLLFRDCLFVNLSATAMTSAFAVASGFDANNKRVLLKDCALIGATDWEGNNRGILYLNNGTITGGGNAGLFAVSNST